jgi:serine/threonine protein kinase
MTSETAMICGLQEISWVTAALFVALASVALNTSLRGWYGSAKPELSFGRYRALQKLGEGGMGVVYEARDATEQCRVAVKLVRGEANPRRLARFESEIRILASIRHRNVVTLRDQGTTRDGARYFAMELLEGVDLQRVVDERGAQSPTRVVRVLLELCDALAAVHDAGIVHRDVKPANVFLARGTSGRSLVKLLDFGLATRTGEPTRDSDDEVVGSPHGMAPECFVDPNALTPAADVYSVGVLAYTLLTGAPPFTGGNLIQIAAQHLHAEPPQLLERCPARVSPELRSVIASCLQKTPERRPASMRALRRALLASPEASSRSAQRPRACMGARTTRLVHSADLPICA